MRFFGRKTETAELLKIREASKREARMTVVTGRRRVGKTELIRHALDDGKTPFVYFLITPLTNRQLPTECLLTR